MKLAIMQPYFLPYIGYWQLMNAVDKFVVYDNIQYTKKGWINRNRFLQNGEPAYFTIPLKKDSDYLNIVDRRIADDFNPSKIHNQLNAVYKKAPHYMETMNVVEATLQCKERGLFDYIYHSIQMMRSYLDINSELVISSEIQIDHSLKGKDKVLALCKSLQADEYINPIGGIELYDKNEFMSNGIKLSFLKSNLTPYAQDMEPFIEALSIIDMLMYCGQEGTKAFLVDYCLL